MRNSVTAVVVRIMENEQENCTIFSLRRIYPVAQGKCPRVWSPSNINSSKFHAYSTSISLLWRGKRDCRTSEGPNA